MAGERNGYAIGVDLGTSNTVAVVRWPDGRTRPLLFDGQPILPSAIYLDEGGRLHVGRDAQRLALLDPSRYEPNPKRRIDEGMVLLGEREGPVVGLLSAILQAIAAKATEACGLLPPAVITYPASWAAARRGILQEAVQRAGWREARLLPEPIAAARYFADSLHRPVPEGGYLAVFDFGGGTLDIAVVQNQHGSFQVIGSGGAEDLGGLDFDAALVNHLGGLLAERHPEVWRQLSAPATPTDRRHRRLFWEDVRGAKEMLSRATVAPVPIPGVDQALHLTREEFERLARPLLDRAVQETAAVISQATNPRRDETQPEWMPSAGQEWGPGQLAGIFLVGGTSRIPLVAQMLHTKFGFAPTVLEQPELPVAEGALAELVASSEVAEHQHAAASLGAVAGAGALLAGPPSAPPAGPPGSPPPGVVTPPGAPISPGAPMSPGGPTPPGVPVSPGDPYQPGQAPPYGPHPPWPGAPARRRRRWAYVATAVAAVAAVVLTLLVLFPAEKPFDRFTQIETVAMQSTTASTSLSTDIQDGWAYLPEQREDEKLRLTAVNLSDPTEKWHTTLGPSATWEGFGALENYLVVYGTDSDSGEKWLHVLNPDEKGEFFKEKVDDGVEYEFLEDRVIRKNTYDGKLEFLDATSGKETGRADYTDFYPVRTWASESDSAAGFSGQRFANPEPDNRVVTVNDTGTIRVLSASDGKEQGSGTLEIEPTTMMAYEGRLFVAGQKSGGSGYQLYSYDLSNMGNPTRLHGDKTESRTADRIEPCGETTVCLVDSDNTLVKVDFNDPDNSWQKKLGASTELGSIKAMEKSIMVDQMKGDQAHTVFYEQDGGAEVKDFAGVAAPVDSTTGLLFDGEGASYSDGQVSFSGFGSTQVEGVGANSGDRSPLGSVDVDPSTCSWDDAYLACAGDEQFLMYSFRSGWWA